MIGNHRLTIRFGDDGRGNDHVNYKLAAPDRGLLECAEKRQVDNASVSDIY